MKKIIYLANTEIRRLSCELAIKKLAGLPEVTEAFEIYQVTDAEKWTAFWESKLKNAAAVIFNWMGTGLSCDFLKRASSFLTKFSVPYLMDLAETAGDKVDGGFDADELDRIKRYMAYSGVTNFQNLCLYLADFAGAKGVTFDEPTEQPWDGIYHPRAEKIYTDADEYAKDFIDEEKPTLGLCFYRNDFLWGRLEFADAMIEGIEREGCNALTIFTNPSGKASDGEFNLASAIKRYFIKDGKSRMGALLNPLPFSLSVTGSAGIDDLKGLGVPILQLYNIQFDKKTWEESTLGLTAGEVGYAVALPEFDGVIHAVTVSTNEVADDGTHYRLPLPERISLTVRRAKKWALLRQKKNAEKKICIVFHNYPPLNSHIGCALALDSIESVRLLLAEMKAQGYKVDRIPEDTKSFIEEMTAHATNDRRFISDTLLMNADGKLTKADYEKFFAALPEKTRAHLERDWDKAPGDVFRYGDVLIVPGLMNGNVFLTVQPPRGFGEDPGKIYHSPDLAPTHHYCGFYHWIRDIYGADALVHVGTHGNLEWLPGKGNALSAACYPDINTGDMPNVYPYFISILGEGIQAKRRSAACLISYLTAPTDVAGLYDALAELEALVEEYYQFSHDESNEHSLPRLTELIREKAKECNLQSEVAEESFASFGEYLEGLHGYLTDLKNMQMSVGLHILGENPSDEEIVDYILALTRTENGKVPSLFKLLAKRYGEDYYDLNENSAQPTKDGRMTKGRLLDEIRSEAKQIITAFQRRGYVLNDDDGDLKEVLTYIAEHIAPALLRTVEERTNTLSALCGNYIEPSPGGAPTSGGADLLPTGRNFYGVDPRTLPTQIAWELGKKLGDEAINQFVLEEGSYPESVGIVLWATSNLRSHGQCVAEFLYLMGLKPVWQPGSRRVCDLEIIPLSELKRPRIDVTGRISGLFRDSMPGSVIWLDDAVRRIAELDEPLDLNFIRKHVLADTAELVEAGMEEKEAFREASFRIFGDPPGAYGAGVKELLEAKNWETTDDLARAYTRFGGHAYGEGVQGAFLPERFQKRLGTIQLTIQNVDHRETSMLSSDDYNNYRGGLIAAVRAYSGEMPKNYVGDSSDRANTVTRTLDEELKRWYRGEAINPKYIEGMKKHGYAGASKLASYVASSYHWDATSEIMEDWMYEEFAQKYALDETMREWFNEVNPWALHRISEVLLEAEQRGMWNANEETKEALTALYLSLEGELEEAGDS